jgi:hypothetical protein
MWAGGKCRSAESEKNLYKPPRPGYIINSYYRQPGRFMAQRGTGSVRGYTKRKLFYTFEEAKEWLDNLPPYPEPVPNVGREWINDYIRIGHQYFPRSKTHELKSEE